MGRECEPERGEPRLRAARRGVSVETRPPARSLASSALGLEPGGDWRASESGSLSCQKRGRAVARGTRVGNGQQRTRLAASSMAAAVPASGSRQAVRGRGGSAARAASEGASHGRGGEGAAGSVSDRRRGGLGVQLAAASSGAMRRGKRERTRRVPACLTTRSPRRAFTQRERKNFFSGKIFESPFTVVR